MLFPERTPLGQVAIYHRETGQRIERWPVDAMGMVQSGEFSPHAPNSEAEKFDLAKDAPLKPVDHQHVPNKHESIAEIDGIKKKIISTICAVCEEELEPPVVTPIEHSPGVPLVASSAGPGQPVKLPGA